MNTIGNIVKEKLQNYEEKLKASNRRSLSRICNCTEGAFLLAMTIYVVGNMNAWTILMLAICVFLIFRIIHIYITITSSLDIRLLYFGMIFCEIVLSVIGFFYTPILLFLGLIFAMLIGFPFLFHKLSLLKN